MPSPVVPSQFCDAIPAPNADLCQRLKKFFNTVSLMCDLTSYLFNSDGTFSDAVITELASTLRPAGEIAISASATMGSGWLLCDGSSVSRTTYGTLFAAIGTRYGVGDGSTTFTLPDFRGRSPIGAGMGSQGGSLTNRNITDKYVGEENHTQTVAEMPAHSHAFATDDGQQVLVEVTGNKVNDINRTGSLDYAHADPVQDTGGGNPFNVVHPCFIAYYFIKT